MSDENSQPAVENQIIEEPAAQIKNSPNELAKLHRECAKYRNALKISNDEKADFQKQLGDSKSELESVLKQKKEQDLLHKLENCGCLKPSLVLKDIPEACDDVEEFLKQYQVTYPFLFQKQKVKHGFSFNGSKQPNYTPSQQMNSYIRSALGR